MQVLITFKLLGLHLLVVWVGAALIFVEIGDATALQDAGTAGLGELLQSLGRKDGSSVVDSLGVVRLMDGDRGVDDLRGVHLLLDHGLDMLMDVVMDTLAGDDGSGGG